MSKRRYNPMLVKIHRSYTVGEIAVIYMVHKNTVRIWIKNGLLTCDDNRPTLILGKDIREFLQNLKKRNRCKCTPNTFYCVSCKQPRKPIGNMVDYIETTSTKGRLVGICTRCNNIINRITNLAKLDQFREYFDITIQQVDKHISES